jgi:peptidoglycan/LPS O-acetylase OafA/YrhL
MDRAWCAIGRTDRWGAPRRTPDYIDRVLVPDEAVDVLAEQPAGRAGPAAAPAPAETEPPREPPAPAAPSRGRPTPGRGEFLAGDGIRGVGMICIIVAHLSLGALDIDHRYYQGLRAGYGVLGGIVLSGLQLALPVFFVLSAYLISRPYIRAYVLSRPTPSLRKYLRHRVLRIVPVFWLLSALMFAVYGTHGSSPADVAAVFGFGQIYTTSGAADFISQAWTIDIEVAFYLTVPLAGWLVGGATRRWATRTRTRTRHRRRGRRPDRAPGRELSPRARVAVITGLLAVATVASIWLRARTLGTLWTQSPPATFYYFTPGLALAALELEFTRPLAAGRLPRLALALGLGAAVIAVALSLALSTDALALVRMRGALGVVLGTGCAFAALLVRQCARGDSPRWVDNRVSRWLGARSYPCYIIQSATILEAVRWVGRVGGPWTELLTLTVVGLPLTLAAGAAVHAAVERPVLAWGRGQAQRAGARSA